MDEDDNIDQIFPKQKKTESDKEKKKEDMGDFFVLNTANNFIRV